MGSADDDWSMVNRRKSKWNDKVVSFFVGNIPEGTSTKSLRSRFERYGKLVDVYIAKKKDRNGLIFGFVRFAGITDGIEFAKSFGKIKNKEEIVIEYGIGKSTKIEIIEWDNHWKPFESDGDWGEESDPCELGSEEDDNSSNSDDASMDTEDGEIKVGDESAVPDTNENNSPLNEDEDSSDVTPTTLPVEGQTPGRGTVHEIPEKSHGVSDGHMGINNPSAAFVFNATSNSTEHDELSL
ncbi:hypothetical protein L2E82_20405 [Cichorium intybus]|uniref:Uncharacterized protein n=1 Tax=Cichorium intybus TaxID=13427 RepID=A0ACB9DSY2_CICIN|nr:hypothetical protein L2E82_20405 [Cichorium intybus]